jgi:hypothetical protein
MSKLRKEELNEDDPEEVCLKIEKKTFIVKRSLKCLMS